nr:hypothetical protein BaRGS_009025 [Batillaria attramentaria]
MKQHCRCRLALGDLKKNGLLNLKVARLSFLNNFTEGAWIVMEYVGERNLQNILNDPKETLEHNQRLSFALQIARGLHYLHSVNVVHLDLKPANIMVTADMKLKIADFGCCHQIPAGNEEGGVSGPAEDGEGLAPVQGPWRNELAGTLAYRAPELLKGQRPALRSDVYSLGITLWQMQSRSGPYEGVPVHSVVFQVVARHLRPQHRSAASLDADNDDSSDDPFELVFSDLYTQCWAPAVEDRPTSLEVVHVIGLWMENLDK